MSVEVPPHTCEVMLYAIDEQSLPLVYDDSVREYSIKLLGAADHYLPIAWCPFCGAKLPDSLRAEWQDRVEDLRLTPDDPRVPMAMRNGEWWRHPESLDQAE